MKLVWVNVTREDIVTGVPADPAYCPLARALRRKLGTPVSMGTDVATVYPRGFGHMPGRYLYATDRTAAFRSLYDRKWTGSTDMLPESQWPVKPGRYAFRDFSDEA